MKRVIISNAGLEPCPFCGSPEVHMEFLTDLCITTIECSECGAIISFVGGERPGVAEEMYNRRAADGLDSIY